MAIVVDVALALMSGKRVSLEADLTASVQSLSKLARRALGVCYGGLHSPAGKILADDSESEHGQLASRRLFDAAAQQSSHVWWP